MSKTFIVDITKFKEANAKHQVLCDGCNASLGERYPKHGSIAVTLPKNYAGGAPHKDSYADLEDGSYNPSKEHNFCSESCMFAKLKERADNFEANRAKEMNQ